MRFLRWCLPCYFRALCAHFYIFQHGLEHLVQERCCESVLAHLQEKKGHENARKRSLTKGDILYHNHDFYYHAPFHVIEALVKAYPKGIVEPTYIRNLFPYPIIFAVYSASKETRSMMFKLFLKQSKLLWQVLLDNFMMHSNNATRKFQSWWSRLMQTFYIKKVQI